MLISEFLNKVSSEEISLYLAADRINPIDDPYLRSARSDYIVARSAGIKCKPKEFEYKYKPQQSIDELKAALMGRAIKKD